MTANDQTPWETEEPKGGFEISSTEGGWSKGPRKGREQRMRRWQRQREETESVRTREEDARVQGEISSRKSSAQFICDSRDECTDEEETCSDQPRTDISENSGATRSTARHEDLHRRPRGHGDRSVAR